MANKVLVEQPKMLPLPRVFYSILDTADSFVLDVIGLQTKW